MKIVMIGQGGHSKVIRDMVDNKNYQFVGYLDEKYESLKFSDDICYGPIIAAWKIMRYIEDVRFVIAIGNNQVRKRIFQQLGLPGQYYITLIHKTAVISPSARIGHGSVVMANAVINADAVIGEHAIINTGSIVEHDNIVSNFVHISPRATLTGSVKIGEGTHIGASSTIIPNIEIGEWSVIGAGATVIRDVPSYCTAVGTPAKFKQKTG